MQRTARFPHHPAADRVVAVVAVYQPVGTYCKHIFTIGVNCSRYGQIVGSFRSGHVQPVQLVLEVHEIYQRLTGKNYLGTVYPVHVSESTCARTVTHETSKAGVSICVKLYFIILTIIKLL